MACLALAGIAAVLPLGVSAATPSPSPNVYRSLDAGSARDAGVVRGTIESVDYSANEVAVREGHRVVLVSVVPSTSIYRSKQYATLSDLRKGDAIEIDVYTINGRLVARSITLR
jgi:Cu/Ag efflux protein CusF